jgi:Ca-activated chloride channel family protein
VLTGTVLPLVGVAVLMLVSYWLLGLADLRRSRKLWGKDYARKRDDRWRTHVPVALLVGVAAFLAIALAQFRFSRSVTNATVVLAIDDSHSMATTDVSPSRIAAAIAAAKAFAAQVPAGFRLGLVTFADQPTVAVPPTTNRGAVDSVLGTLQASSTSGTVIGDGLNRALDAIATAQSSEGGGPGAVVLLSDGNDTGSQVSPTAAAQRASSLGIPVYTVAIGNVSSGSSPTSSGTPTTVKPTTSNSPNGTGADIGLLRQIATTTGARTFTANTAGALDQIYKSLGASLSVELKPGSNAGLFVVLAVVMALAAAGFVLLGSKPRF